MSVPSICLLAPRLDTPSRVAELLGALGYRVRRTASTGAARRLTYCDTWDGRLAGKGWLFRKSEAEGWRLLRAGVLEEQQAAGGAVAGGSAAEATATLARRAVLIPHVDVTVQRHSIDVSLGAEQPFEVELEEQRFSSPLKPGAGGARLLLSIGPETPRRSWASLVSALSRRGEAFPGAVADPLQAGMEALGLEFPASRPPGSTAIGPADRWGAAVAKALDLQVRRMRSCEAGAAADADPEYVHQMRVALRVAREILRFGGELAGSERASRVRAELAWLGGCLGALRDQDILAAHLAASPPALRASARPALERSRRSALKELDGALASERYRNMLGELEALAHAAARARGSGREAAVRRSSRLIRRRIAKLRPAVDADPAALSDTELHELRIRFRRLRYCCELFGSLHRRRMERLLRRVVKYQDRLGTVQDSAMAIGWLRAIEAEAGGETGIAVAAAVRSLEEAARASKGELSRMWPELGGLLRTLKKALRRSPRGGGLW